VDRATSLKFLQDFWDIEAEPVQAPTRGAVALEERIARSGHQPATVLLTGQPGSGKTTIAYALERRLFDSGHQVCVLDGQQLRRTISRDLGYSSTDRSENLRRASDIARLFNEVGAICICAFVAPSRAVREKARSAIGSERFFEVHLTVPEEIRRQREGQPRQESQGDYEAPVAADLVLDTQRLTVDECAARILELLRDRRVLTAPSGGSSQ
jgi:bifunctional enzyme CysN/CysC